MKTDFTKIITDSCEKSPFMRETLKQVIKQTEDFHALTTTDEKLEILLQNVNALILCLAQLTINVDPLASFFDRLDNNKKDVEK